MRWKRACLAVTALASVEGTASAAAAVATDGIVVTAAGRQQDVRDAPASISVIDREALQRLPYREITDALLEVPGVTVTPGEGNSRDISIRGFSPQYTLILVDGKRLSSRETRTNGGNTSEGGLLPPMEAIDRIEVVRGPMSSLYGSDAMGGVVNVITRRIGDHWRGSVRANATHQFADGFRDFGDANAYVAGPLVEGLLGLQLQGSVNRRPEDRIIGGTPERKDENASVKLGLRLGRDHDLLVEAGHFRQKVTQTAGRSTGTTATVPEGTTNVQTQIRDVYSIQHDGRWGFATSSSYVLREDARNRESLKEVKNTVGQSIFTVPLPANILNLGAFFREEDLKDLTGNTLAGSTRRGARRSNWALFAEDEWTVVRGFALTAGLRMDRDGQFGTNWSPRLYGVWKMTRALTLKGGVSRGFRAPNIRQILADWGQTSRGGTIYGNPGLKAETSLTYEGSLLYDGPGRWQGSATVYQTDFNDRITRLTCVQAGAWCVGQPLSSIGRPPTTYVNVDKARVRGLELSVTAPLTTTLTLVGSGTLTDSEQRSGANRGAALNDTPKQQASASLNWKPDRRLSAYARLIYRGEEAVTEAQISGENVVAKGYATVDIGGSYRLDRTLSLFGGLQNLFDKRLAYADYAYVIDGARIWMGIGARF
jgi:outer membrane receptor for ferrienterochelin and colicins